MRRSSSPFEVTPQLLDALLEVEASLAMAQAKAGVIPHEHAVQIASVATSLRLDPDEVAEAAADTGTPVLFIVRRTRAALSSSPAADHVHFGATSQDILDTATMLLTASALDAVSSDLEAATVFAARLAAGHRHTLMPGRTLLQPALPTTFGLLAASWLHALDTATDRIEMLRKERLAVQLGGPVGTLAAFGRDGPAVLEAFASELGLAVPVMPWHSDRTRIAELAGVLGTAAGVIRKVSGDVILLAQKEIGEVSERVADFFSPGVEARSGDGASHEGRLASSDRGASSSIPGKRNPIAAVSARAFAERAPGLVANLFATMGQELQRSAGSWHAEHRSLTELLGCVAQGASWLRECLDALEVNDGRMRANLQAESAPGDPAKSQSSGDLLTSPGDGPLALIERSLTFHRTRRAIPLAFSRTGNENGKALVLAGSLGTDRSMWEDILPVVGEFFDVIRIDIRGHGGSDVPPGPYDVSDLGADVIALLDRLGVTRAHFAGLSIGGMTGIWLAVNAPERINRLVLCCTSPHVGPPSMWAKRAADVRAQGMGVVEDAVLARWFTPATAEVFGADSPAGHGFRSMLRAIPVEGYAGCCEAIGAFDMRADLAAIDAPTLVIAGADDPAMPPAEHARPLAAAIRAARLEVVENAAHLAPAEQPDAVARLILEHLKGS